jgi:hypothetical protein
MFTKHYTLATIASLLALGACGGTQTTPTAGSLAPTPSTAGSVPTGTSQTPAGSGNAAVPAVPAPASSSARDLVARLASSEVGCADPQESAGLVTDDGLRCQSKAGRSIVVLAKLAGAARADYLDIMDDGGFGAAQYLVLGDGWIVNASDGIGELAARVSSVLGGEVRKYDA